MTTWVLVALGVVFLAALTVFALIYTHTHPIEQENPWSPSDATSTTAPER